MFSMRTNSIQLRNDRETKAIRYRFEYSEEISFEGSFERIENNKELESCDIRYIYNSY